MISRPLLIGRLSTLIEAGFAEHVERGWAGGFFHHQLLRGERHGGARWLAGHFQQLLLLVTQPGGGLEVMSLCARWP